MDALTKAISRFSSNRGYIQAMALQLYDAGDRVKFKAYLKTLTPEQYQWALNHFNTVKQLRINQQAWGYYCNKETEKMEALRSTLDDEKSASVRRYIKERRAVIARKVPVTQSRQR